MTDIEGNDTPGGAKTASDTAHRTIQVVVFRLADREFAFPLTTVSEVLPMIALTQVPGSPSWLPGMINLRGDTLPVIDLRRRLGLAPRAVDPELVIVICEPQARGRVGFIADSVLNVMTLATEPVDARNGLNGSDQPLIAVARNEDRLVVILDVDQLVKGSPLTNPSGESL